MQGVQRYKTKMQSSKNWGIETSGIQQGHSNFTDLVVKPKKTKKNPTQPQSLRMYDQKWSCHCG